MIDYFGDDAPALPPPVLELPYVEPVMGLADVARGRGVMAPTTIYLVSGDDTSGPVGVLYPDGHLLSKWASACGQRFEVEDEFLHTYECEVKWDGAQKSPCSAIPLGYADYAQTQPIYQEHSKGLLLGAYAENGELWRALARGTSMQRTILGFNLGRKDLDSPDRERRADGKGWPL